MKRLGYCNHQHHRKSVRNWTERDSEEGEKNSDEASMVVILWGQPNYNHKRALIFPLAVQKNKKCKLCNFRSHHHHHHHPMFCSFEGPFVRTGMSYSMNISEMDGLGNIYYLFLLSFSLSCFVSKIS